MEHQQYLWSSIVMLFYVYSQTTNSLNAHYDEMKYLRDREEYFEKKAEHEANAAAGEQTEEPAAEEEDPFF